MEELEACNDLSVAEKEKKIRLEFDCARKDISLVQAKIDCKLDEIRALEQNSAGNTNELAPTSVGNQSSSNHVIHSGHPSDN